MILGFWKSLFSSIGSIVGSIGGSMAPGTPMTGGNIGGNTMGAVPNNTHINFSDATDRLYTTTATSNIYLEPGTNMTIEPGALGGSATITTRYGYDQNNMDRLIYFDNTAGTDQTGTITTWTNGTSTAAIQDLRIHEYEWRMQQTQQQAQQYLQGRINQHLDQQLDAQRARYRGQMQADQQAAQPQQRFINTTNYDAYAAMRPRNQAEVYRPFGGDLRHAPPNLKTPRAIAEVRGKNLLKNIIGDVLFHHYEKNGYVDLPSIEKPGVGFRIRPHRRIGLLKQNRKGQWVEQKESLCIHAKGGYWVEGDQVGIHYMLCQCDEKKLWKQAIVHRVAA